MKKMKSAMVAGVIIFILSSCGNSYTDLGEEPEEERQSISDEVDLYESEGLDAAANEPSDFQNGENTDGQIGKDDELEILTGEYEYLSDYGIGKLVIEKTSCGYDISDYESESSYRFLAESSNSIYCGLSRNTFEPVAPLWY